MSDRRFAIGEGGSIVDTATGKIVAVDKTQGIIDANFPDLEQVGVFSWDKLSLDLLDDLTAEDYDRTKNSIASLSKKYTVTKKEIKNIIEHPAFILRMNNTLKKEYEFRTAQRHREYTSLLDKLGEELTKVMDTGITSLTAIQSRTLSTLLREIRKFRELEKVEHGEVIKILEHRAAGTADSNITSIQELVKLYPEIMSEVATRVIMGQDKHSTQPPKNITDAYWTDSTDSAQPNDLPPAPPEFPDDVRGATEDLAVKTHEDTKQPPSTVFNEISKIGSP